MDNPELRLGWDSIWMSLAQNISSRSKDPKVKVGAVIVVCNNESVLSLGYNGDEKGGTNKRDSDKENCSGFLHAEINAMIKLDYNDPRDKKIYITHSPCIVCARAIINANIKEVYYLAEFRDPSGLKLLSKRGIVCKKLAKGN